jgi:hypothetical protein
MIQVDYIPHPDSVQSFFSDYYASLRTAGVTFTKCDNMASIDHISSATEVSFTQSGDEITGEPVEVPDLRKAYVRAVKTAAREAFGGENVIWCMGMTPRVLLGEIGLGGDRLKRVVRNSDDCESRMLVYNGSFAYSRSIERLPSRAGFTSISYFHECVGYSKLLQEIILPSLNDRLNALFLNNLDVRPDLDMVRDPINHLAFFY